MTKLPATAKFAFNETSPSTVIVDAIVTASVTSNVDESVVPKSTCKVESIVVAPPIESAVFNETSF